MRAAIAFVLTLTSTSVFASDELAAQIDQIVPLPTAEQLTTLGGPNTPETIVEGIEGRWFTLQNTVRNWTGNGEEDRRRLAQTIERTCSDTWENIVTHEVTGPGSFIVSQRSPSGEDQGTFEIQPVEGEANAFTTFVNDQDILAMMKLEGATASEQEAALAQVRGIMNQGVEIWRPTPDLMINSGAGEVEIWGRCP